MSYQKKEVCIKKVICVFSDYFWQVVYPDELFDEWKETLRVQGIEKVLTFSNDEYKNAADIESNLQLEIEEKALFLVSDINDLCKSFREEKGVPSILYLHDDNKGDSIDGIPQAIMSFDGIDKAFLSDVYKRFFNIPWTIMETKRCYLREMTEEDLDDLYLVYEGEGMTDYIEGLYEDKEKERAYIRDYRKNVYELCGMGIWLIVLKESDEVIGRAGLAWRDEFESPELGFIVAQKYHRQGYAYEVCLAILDFCRDVAFDEVRILYQKENIASHNLTKKLGFQKYEELVMDDVTMINATCFIS